MNQSRLDEMVMQLLLQKANDPAKDPRYVGMSFAPETPLGPASGIPAALQSNDLAYPRHLPDARFR